MAKFVMRCVMAGAMGATMLGLQGCGPALFHHEAAMQRAMQTHSGPIRPVPAPPTQTPPTQTPPTQTLPTQTDAAPPPLAPPPAVPAKVARVRPEAPLPVQPRPMPMASAPAAINLSTIVITATPAPACAQCETIKMTVSPVGDVLVERSSWDAGHRKWRYRRFPQRTTPAKAAAFATALASDRPLGVKAASGDEACADGATGGATLALRWIDGARDDRLDLRFACSAYAGSAWDARIRAATAQLELARPVF